MALLKLLTILLPIVIVALAAFGGIVIKAFKAEEPVSPATRLTIIHRRELCKALSHE